MYEHCRWSTRLGFFAGGTYSSRSSAKNADGFHHLYVVRFHEDIKLSVCAGVMVRHWLGFDLRFGSHKDSTALSDESVASQAR